jgi:hypothetical protein
VPVATLHYGYLVEMDVIAALKQPQGLMSVIHMSLSNSPAKRPTMLSGIGHEPRIGDHAELDAPS